MNRKLEERCLVLAQLLKVIGPVYKNKNTDQKNFIETILGAAIWYLPQSKELWTGKISRSALMSFSPKNTFAPLLTKDHEFPRKIAARELLKIKWKSVQKPGMKILDLYNRKYGKFNYLTPLENRVLMKFQRVDSFVSPEVSYKNAKINLLKITAKQFIKVLARDLKTIDALLSKKGRA